MVMSIMEEKMLKETILQRIEEKNMDSLKNLLSESEELEILQAFYELYPEDQVIVFRLLKKNTALELFEHLDTDEQQNLLRSFTDDKAVEYINELAPDDRVKLLDELPAKVAKKLINSLSAEERKSTNVLMGYAAQTAGRIMTTEYISLNREMTVESALTKIRNQAEDKETVYTLYITSPHKRLEGVISLKDLVLAKDNPRIEEIMSRKAISVTTDTDQEEVAQLLKELDLLAIPVVDKENRIVGIVTVDDAIDILEEEATEDIFDQAGLVDITSSEANRSEVLVQGRLWSIWKVRLPFLLITLVAGFLAGLVMEGFEEILESVTIVAFFIPLIMDMGGNVGTQSSTVFARGVVLGHVKVKHFTRHFVKEIGVGFSMGLLIGILAYFVVSLWTGMPLLGLSVGLALIVTMTLAALLGFLVPFVLIKMHVDQAAGSAPIITSIKDIAGLMIYFTFISLFLGSLLY